MRIRLLQAKTNMGISVLSASDIAPLNGPEVPFFYTLSLFIVWLKNSKNTIKEKM